MQSGNKSMWCTSAQDNDDLKPEPEPPMETENDRLGVHTLLSLHTPPMMRSPQEKEAARHFDSHNSVISLLSTSPGSSTSSDTNSTGTDRSNGPHYMARYHSSEVTAEPMLDRMSSVSLMEDEDGRDKDEGDLPDIRHVMPAHDAHLVIRPAAKLEYLDSDEEISYIREANTPIPLNTMTQEKVRRKRPAPSPASGRSNLNETLSSWKRNHESSPAMKKPFARRALLDDGCLSTPTGGKSSMLAKLASNLLHQMENEPAGTLLVYQPTCLDHHNDSHQESRQRLCVLGGPEGVLHKDRFDDLKWANLDELRPARLNDILRVHTMEYIQHLERSCDNLPEQNKDYLVGTLFDKQKGDEKLTYDEWLQNYPLPPSWAPVQFSSYKPWRDEKDSDNVFFSSIHLYDDDNFYPCSGVGPHGCSPELEKSKNIVNLPLKVLGPKYLDERLKLTSKAKRSLMEQSSKTFRNTVTKKLIPALTKFRPDLIMLSAGFDGHADDFYYFLSEDDYGWITDQITAVAEDCCDGRIVSVLEGGYNVVPSKFQRPRPKARKSATSNFHYAAKMHNRPVDEELNSYGSLARSLETQITAMSERKAVIKNADMHEDMQQDAVDCASQALEKYNIEKDIAAFIKKEFDKKYNPTWHCIVGRNFGSYVTHETKHFIYFYLGQVAILLFKSG
ncbi:Histone deacetylase [Phytophthora palmivora]|uniref:Histone deacetylase n=1 Tax=Phytophthora palmivora TaxID=4796 RepID=A0A2P4YGA7_9STRA|nr:Histone deacetylase [Phytophthora palmivora]